MHIKEITDYTVWTNHFNEFGSPSFLQSWEWGEVQRKLGYRVMRLGIYEKDELTALSQVVKIKARRGNMLFAPHGPLINPKTQSLNTKYIVQSLLHHLIAVAKNENFDFIRIAPVFLDGVQERELFAQLGMRTSPIYMHAERMWVLDLQKTEDELLAGMRKTTRYSIRKAAKEGVVIEKRTDANAIKDFWNIYEKTAQRENFTPFSQSFIIHEFEEFFRTGNAIYLLGKTGTDKDYEAGALVVFTESAGFYHQGASLHSKIPVAYLMQWEAIREAKKRGCRLYNFWGILQQGRTPKNWGGLSLFKQGFGGRQVDYVPTQDYVVNPLKYGMSYLYEQYLKVKRGV